MFDPDPDGEGEELPLQPAEHGGQTDQQQDTPDQHDQLSLSLPPSLEVVPPVPQPAVRTLIFKTFFTHSSTINLSTFV